MSLPLSSVVAVVVAVAVVVVVVVALDIVSDSACAMSDICVL